MLRREFLNTAGIAISATALSSSAMVTTSTEAAPQSVGAADWSTLRNMFPLTRDYIHLSTFLGFPAAIKRSYVALILGSYWIVDHIDGFDKLKS